MEAVPTPVRHHGAAGDDEDQLVVAQSAASSRRRAAASRSVTAPASGPPARSSSRSQASSGVAQVAEPGRNRRGIRGDDAGAHRHVAAGEPGHPLPAARGESGLRRPVPTIGSIAGPGHRLDERRRQDEGKVADRRYRGVMLRRRHLDEVGPAGSSQSLDPLPIDRAGAGSRDDDPRPAVEQVGRRCPIAARLAAGHRVATHEPQPGRVCPGGDRLFRARDVCHHGVRPHRPGQPAAAQLVDQVEGREGRSGQHDEVGIADGVGESRARLVEDALVPCPRRPVTRWAPRRDRPLARVAPERARDRSPDQAKTEQSHPHRPSIAGRRRDRLACRPWAAVEPGFRGARLKSIDYLPGPSQGVP